MRNIGRRRPGTTDVINEERPLITIQVLSTLPSNYLF